MERNYEFRRRLESVHVPDRRNLEARPGHDEILIENGWSIVISKRASGLVLNIAKDLQDYLLVSMNTALLLRRESDITSLAREGKHLIILATREELPEVGRELSIPRSYRIVSSPDRIVVCGNDDRGVGQGSYYLEDLMNLREAPILRQGDVVRQPLFSPRMVHSGWGLDQFPDAHLNAIAHAGMDSILVFVTGVDRTPNENTHRLHQSQSGKYQDFNNLVDRAARFGLDVYAYSYLQSLKHPEEPDAEAYYESTYGAIFEACPGFKGVVLVGESVEFPSKDPRTTQKLRLQMLAEGIKPTKPTPGWWPCYDYPQWLNMIKKVIRKHNPGADIVFWTYNWGWAPEEDRLALIRTIPDDVSLLVTFEMFEKFQREGITVTCVDYTVSFEGPGKYFSSEARVAHERGIRLYTMCNTGGLTWDIGVIPYEPVPYQWARRHAALLKAHDEWGLSGLMESHHYGWWPSFVSELAKWAYWSPSPAASEVCEAIARRDFGDAAVPLVLEAWQDWSEAIRDYIPTNEDQYGPFRIGPAYPLVFQQPVTIPAAWYAMFGNLIVNPNYQPHEGGACIDVEIRILQRMAERWGHGIECLEKALPLVPERKQPVARGLLRLGRFILNSVLTTIHVKQWWRLKQRLLAESCSEKASAILDEMARVAEEEIANAEATIPLVEADSRLGWEPSMEYMTDPEHLRWKIAQVRGVLDNELPNYRKSLGQAGGCS